MVGEMKVVTFIEPPQTEVIDKILRQCGLWHDRTSRAPPDIAGLVKGRDFSFSTRQNRPSESHQAQELHYGDVDTFLATV